jgi:hypothetical protein
VNRWLTWRARLEHLFVPGEWGCQCHVCATDRREEIARRLALVEKLRSHEEMEKWQKKT